MIQYIKRDIISYGNELDFWKKYISAFLTIDGFKAYDRSNNLITNFDEYITNEFLVDTDHTAQSRQPYIKLLYNDYFPLWIIRNNSLNYPRGRNNYNGSDYTSFTSNLTGTSKTYYYMCGTNGFHHYDNSNSNTSERVGNLGIYIPKEFLENGNRNYRSFYIPYPSSSWDYTSYDTNNTYQEAHLMFIQDKQQKFLNILFGDESFALTTLDEYYTNIMFIETNNGHKIIGGSHNYNYLILNNNSGTSYTYQFTDVTNWNYYYNDNNPLRCGFWEIGNETVRNIRFYIPIKYTLNSYNRIDMKKGVKLVLAGSNGMAGDLRPYDDVSVFYVCSNVPKGRIITVEGKNYYSVSENLLLPYDFDDSV